MTWRAPIVAYEERGHKAAIYPTPPCVIAMVDGAEIGPFYENMAAARKGVSRQIDGIIKAEKEKK